MTDVPAWPRATPVLTPRLRLEPLRVQHAPEAVTVLDDVRLHAWTGGSPCTLEELEARYRRQAAGRSPDGRHGWLNWMLRRLADGRLVGTVQATLSRPERGGLEAELAWVIGVAHQGRGYGGEAALAMAGRLRDDGVDVLTAHIHPGHRASAGIARALGLRATDRVDEGEVLWRGPVTALPARTARTPRTSRRPGPPP
ncbi:GNAT family N-acetyltransferase [Streptomyces misionensis]|uniref:GNAT family N-acetyltransferase n=1 Tax=Streptomyces misionensis TaxID=67331 RepID=A0A5C6IQB2_9ACTN|nr:GNAT family N-acetyltransferase [Streptomyces misionensis]TWV30693.1 GNAT family N-acetyltransferase [Streptomyces misionensis]